ncbi:hypothetical protein ACFL2J_02780 [Candidatus Omnitrophota bacterium]
MNTLTNNIKEVSERWQSGLYLTGSSFYWTWTGRSRGVVLLDKSPACQNSRAFSFFKTRKDKMNKKINWLIFGLMFLYLCFFAFNSVSYGAPENAAETAEEEVSVEEKQISGEMLSFFPRGAPTQIGISVEEENTDYHFKLGEDVEIVNKKDLKQISMGDRIGITYDEITTTKEDGSKKTERIATKITFLSPAIKGLRSGR